MVYFHVGNNPDNDSGYGLFPGRQQPLQYLVGMVYFQAVNNPYNGSGYGLFPSWQQPLQW